MYGIGYGGHQQNWQGEPAPESARLSGRAIASPRTDEGKFAKTFIAKTNLITFDPTAFAIMVNAIGGQQMQPRVMEIVKAMIRNLSDAYDAGIVNSATVDAKRLADTMDRWQM